MNANRKFSFHSEQSGTALTIKVLPGAKVSKIAKIRPDGCVIINLTHPASDARCHTDLVQFLAGILVVDPAKIEIIAGDAGDYKIISVLDLDSASADDLLRRQIKKMD